MINLQYRRSHIFKGVNRAALNTFLTTRCFASGTGRPRKVPAILSDIDGVMYRGGSRIGGSQNVI